MRTYGKGRLDEARAKENLTRQTADQVIAGLRESDLNGLIAWGQDDANQGATEAQWVAAWPFLAQLTPPQQRFVIRFAVALGGGMVVG